MWASAAHHHVVDEGFRLPGALGDAEDLREHLLAELQVGCRLEGGVEREEGPRALEAVAGEVKFLHSVHWGMSVGVFPCGLDDVRFWTWNLRVAPFGTLARCRYRSLPLRASKNMICR